MRMIAKKGIHIRTQEDEKNTTKKEKRETENEKRHTKRNS